MRMNKEGDVVKRSIIGSTEGFTDTEGKIFLQKIQEIHRTKMMNAI